jgi:uncharacterized protein YbjT (DUF2867 family)
MIPLSPSGGEGQGEGGVNAILFGATGMVGQGVLRELLHDPGVKRVLAVTRRPTGVEDDKFHELVLDDFFDFSSVANELTGYDACFFCLGVSSAGMSEKDYKRLTYDLTMAAARTLAERNSGMRFEYVSGTGTDSTEKGRVMWARVKGATENALMRLPFKAAYMIRPGYIQPLHGIRSSTKWTRVAYAVAAPLFPLWKSMFPGYVITTEELGRAMIRAARVGCPKRILEIPDLIELGRG